MKCTKSIALFVVSTENLKTLKYHAFLKVLSVLCGKCEKEDEYMIKEEELIEISKILALIKNL